MSAAVPRTMDCIDCHNRPSHNYNSPPVYFDRAMLTGGVSREIPFIKKTAMEILANTFTDRDTAIIQIRDLILNFYKSDYPDYLSDNNDKIEKSITSVQNAFSQNTFPAMGVNYSVYPDHIGHLETEGCFRCHNDAFVSETGRRITRDCNICHTIVGQGKPGAMNYSNIREPLEFVHPVDIGTAWSEANCSECHKFLY